MLENLLTLSLIHFVVTVSPGPEFMLITKEALIKGRKSAFITLFGTLSGLVVHLTYSAFGLAALIAQSAETLLLLQIIGGGYLIYLGIGGLRSKAKPASSHMTRAKKASVSHSVWKTFRTGMLCDLLNPKAPLYFVALFTFFLSPNMPATDLLIYSCLIISVHFSWFAVVIWLLSTPAVNQKFQRLSHWIDRVLGGAMLAIGIKVMAG